MQDQVVASKLKIVVFAMCAVIGAASHAAAAQTWGADWIALTVAPDGVWGSAIDSSRSAAIATAIGACQRNSGERTGTCGATTVTVRAASSLAFACGDTTILATGASYAEARMTAINQEIELKQIERVELAPCRLLIAIDPDGRPAPTETTSEIMPLIGTSFGSR